MKEEVKAPNCGRESELVAFLYGELDSVETDAFKHHMLECVECRTEMEGLGQVRKSVVSWRNESLGAVSSSASTDSQVEIVGQRPSAMAALRQFFDLSPLWMKGAVAFASLLFCLFAGLAIARLREAPLSPVAANPNSSEYSESEMKAVIDRRVQEELQRIKNSPEQLTASRPVVDRAPVQTPPVQFSKRSTEVARGLPTQKARRPLTKTEREQLATDLRLVTAMNDNELDLLDDRINE